MCVIETIIIYQVCRILLYDFKTDEALKFCKEETVIFNVTL